MERKKRKDEEDKAAAENKKGEEKAMDDIIKESEVGAGGDATTPKGRKEQLQMTTVNSPGEYSLFEFNYPTHNHYITF